MKIVITKKNEVDLYAPIHMSDKQKLRFIRFMKELFPAIGVRDVVEPEKHKGPINSKSRKWSKKDYEILLLTALDGEDEDSLMSKLNRSDMSIIQKIGTILPEYLRWEEKNARDNNREKRVEKFVSEYFGEVK